MRSVRITWPPVEKPAKIKGNRRTKRDGEPTVLLLERWTNDSTLRTSTEKECCDCGLRHVLTFEVLRAGNKEFYLLKRAYRIMK